MGNNAVGYKRCANNDGDKWKYVGDDPIRYYRRIDVLWKLKVGKKAINCHWFYSIHQ